MLIYSESSREASLKKGHVSWDLNVKEDRAKQESEGRPFPTEGQVVENPEAGMDLVYSQNRKEGRGGSCFVNTFKNGSR